MFNTDTIQKLYDFGALLVYEVSYFDELSFCVRIHKRTFSVKVAKAEYEALIKNKQKVKVDSYFVKFDGAYSE